MNKTYTGIGSRDCTPEGFFMAEVLAFKLALAGFRLKTGAAEGIDEAFTKGARRGQGAIDTYIPWKGYNGSPSPLFGVNEEALKMASTTHPSWSSMSLAHQKHLGCAAHQVLGPDLATPSAFTLCWTPDGCDSESTRTGRTRGTASGIIISERNGIRCFNLNSRKGRLALTELFTELGLSFQHTEPPHQATQASLFG